MSTTKRKHILLVDASSLRESGCILRFWNIVVEGYRSEVVPNDMTFGTGFHLYRKLFEQTGNAKFGIDSAVTWFTNEPAFVKYNKTHLTPEFLRKVCRDYHMHYEFQEDYETVRVPYKPTCKQVINADGTSSFVEHTWEADVCKSCGLTKVNESFLIEKGKPLVELKFGFPYYQDEDVEVILVGTVDAIVRSKTAGFYAVKDYKTTSVWDVKNYFEAYRMSTQLMTYTAVIRRFAELHDLPNNFAQDIVRQGFGAFIDGIFLASGKGKAETTFARSEVMFFTPRDMADFETGLAQQVAKLVAAVKNPGLVFREGMINSSCEKVYGKCNFFNACATPDKESYDMVMQHNFIRKPYNPLNFS